MNNKSLQMQIKSLETQLGILRAQLATGAESVATKRCFADLFGILSGKSDTSEEEILKAEYHFDWDTK